MSDSAAYDLVIKNARVVRPHGGEPVSADIAITRGAIQEVGRDVDGRAARNVVDANGLLAFPGVVDAHMHVGIYNPLHEDARTESRAAAAGGVTSSLNYIRTGQYYLNRGGPYRSFFPEVLAQAQGNFYVDYGFHVAPISGEHIEEMEWLLADQGVSSFKIFMFYGGYGLHGKSDMQSQFLMLGPDERYDMAHFEFVMRGLCRLRARYPRAMDHLSVSLHCEVADILRAYTERVEREGRLTGLAAYSAARPPHSEGLAICIASYLAHETECVNVNLLHLSSRKAIDAALRMSEAFPHVDFRREVTVGHLLLDIDAPTGTLAKVNPPIRPREDVEALWESVLAGQVDWIVSDHACCSAEQKRPKGAEHDVWVAKSGFGGTEYLLAGVFSEGRKRGLAPTAVARLLSWNPAQRFGLFRKGDIAAGFDADIVLLDPERTHVIRGADSPSGQGYTPFEGQELTARVERTFLRGRLIYDRGHVIGTPEGVYLTRST